MTDTLDKPLRHAIGSGALPAVAAMAATSNGVIHRAAFGLRNPTSGSPMTTDSVAWVASMTKAITSVAALRLVEQGKLSLDDPICDVLPELVAPMVLERFGADGVPILHKASTAITLRHLLTHTAGYGYDTWNPALWHLQTRLGVPRIPSSPDELRQVPLLFNPGTRWNYGINTDVVGRVIEVATGKTLADALRDSVTGPLGMSDTVFIPDAEQRERRLVMHQRDDDGTLTPIFWHPPEPRFMAGGGGLYSTAEDYLKLQRAILSGGNDLLGQETFTALTTNQIGGLEVTPLSSAVPAASRNIHLYPGMSLKWTLGFLLNTEATAEGRAAGSLAWAGLSNCYYWIDRTRDVCGVFISGLLPFGDEAALSAFRAYEAAVYQTIG
jgi:methyl acetate hydrolase